MFDRNEAIVFNPLMLERGAELSIETHCTFTVGSPTENVVDFGIFEWRERSLKVDGHQKRGSFFAVFWIGVVREARIT